MKFTNEVENWNKISTEGTLKFFFLIEIFQIPIRLFVLSLEFSKIIENDMDEDGRLSFEEFFQVMKSNKKLNKLILKIADAWLLWQKLNYC